MSGTVREQLAELGYSTAVIELQLCQPDMVHRMLVLSQDWLAGRAMVVDFPSSYSNFLMRDLVSEGLRGKFDELTSRVNELVIANRPGRPRVGGGPEVWAGHEAEDAEHGVDEPEVDEPEEAEPEEAEPADVVSVVPVAKQLPMSALAPRASAASASASAAASSSAAPGPASTLRAAIGTSGLPAPPAAPVVAHGLSDEDKQLCEAYNLDGSAV